MERLKRSLSVAGPLGILAVVAIVINMRPAEAQAPGPPDGLAVRIVSPLPVPTTGSISGTVAVTQSGEWNVGIADSPLAVRNIDEPGRAPFQQLIYGADASPVLSKVPAGKRLVIQSVSFEAIAARTVPGYVRLAVFGPASADYSFPLTFVGNRSGVGNFYVSNAQVTVYVDSTNAVQFFSDNGFGAPRNLGVTVSGYLVDCSSDNPCAEMVS